MTNPNAMEEIIFIQEWPLPSVQTFEDATVEVDFFIEEGVITKVKRVACVFKKKGYPEQARALSGIPILLEKQVLKALDDDLDNILTFIAKSNEHPI